MIFSTNTPSILVQRADRLGDLVLALPVLEALKKAFPDCQIDCLCSDRNKQLIQHHPLVREVLCFNQHLTPSKQERQAFISQVREKRYDCLINLWAEPFFEALGKRAGIPIRIGPKTSPLSAFYYTHPVRLHWDDLPTHEMQFNLQCLAPLMPVPTQGECRLYPSQWTPYRGFDSGSGKKRLVFFCSSGKQNCVIPESQQLQLIKTLADTGLYDIYLTYGNIDDASPLVQLEYSNVTNIRQLLDLPELMGVLAGADFYFGPDTGPSHIASFLNKRCVLLYKSGVNPPVRWGPFCDRFGLIRLDYLSDSAPKVSRENTDILSAFSTLTNDDSAFSEETKVLHHRQSSYRFLWLCQDLDDFNQDKAKIRALRQQGWVIFVHIKRRFFWAHLRRFVFKCRRRHINAFYSPKSWLVSLVSVIFYTQAMPRCIRLDKPY